MVEHLNVLHLISYTPGLVVVVVGLVKPEANGKVIFLIFSSPLNMLGLNVVEFALGIDSD